MFPQDDFYKIDPRDILILGGGFCFVALVILALIAGEIKLDSPIVAIAELGLTSAGYLLIGIWVLIVDKKPPIFKG